MPIKLLSEDIVAQIAAGEVIERPTSVVKEMLENSLDAGARHLHLALNGDGRRRIQISDDGCGIPVEEVELAFARHATSKLDSADDLYNIRTLGFRGEALASIAAVSHLTMTTRHESDSTGTHLKIQGGVLQQRRAVGSPTGTVITVEHLFFNMPARLKFLKKETTEKRHIASLITRYALAYPHVRFVLEQDGREVFRTNGGGNLLDVMVSAMGIDQVRDMLEVDDQYGDVRVFGFTSMPRMNRADRSRITLFVNGRSIQDSSLTYAVIQAYHTLLMTGRFPIAVLMIEVPPPEVDVNVHPAKAEVRFRDQDSVFTAVQRAVRRAVISQAQTPYLRERRPVNAETSVWEPHRQLDMDLNLQSPGQFSLHRHTDEQQPADPTAIPYGADAPAMPRTLPLLRVVGQVSASYIVAEGPAGMYLIDQHAAHERILFEQFMADYHKQESISQLMLAAQTVQVSPDEARLIEDNLPLLSAIGFTIEAFGPNVFVIRAIPALLADADPTDLIAGIVDDLIQGNTPGMDSIENKIVLRVCKTAAVKAGQILNFDQMQGLIRQLERCQAPLTCPHGRPTMIHLSRDHLAREFGRLG